MWVSTRRARINMEGGRARRWLRVIGHDGEELLFVNLAVLVEVELVDHGLSVKKEESAGCEGSRARDTHNSSSSRRSPISFATRLRFRRLILPVLSSSNNWNVRRISSMGSRASMRSLTKITRSRQLKSPHQKRVCRARTDLRKVLKVHESMSSLVVVAQNLQHLRLLHVEPERAHGDFELVVVDAAILVGVEELEGLFDLLFLLLGEFWARVGAALGLLGSGGGVHCHGRGRETRCCRLLTENFPMRVAVHVCRGMPYSRLTFALMAPIACLLWRLCQNSH